MACLARFHWRAPALMLGGLLVGVLAAVGHHLFYQSLSRSAAPTGDYKLGRSILMPKQQANTTIGTAFAFLFKTALMLTISTAYVQTFWRSVKSQSVKRPLDLDTLDVAYGALSNILAFFHTKIWLRSPQLLLIALVALLLPIASIITPATLSIVPAHLNVTQMLAIPVPDFTTMNFLGPMPLNQETLGNLWNYGGPSEALRKVVSPVAAQGSILPIVAPNVNASWSIDFSGPSLKCGDIPTARSLHIQQNMAAALTVYNNATTGCTPGVGYMAWLQRSADTNDTTSKSIEPFDLIRNNVTSVYETNFTVIFEPGSVSQLGNDANLTFYVAVTPYLIDGAEVDDDDDGDNPDIPGECTLWNSTPENPLGDDGRNATFIQCQLYNTSYHVDFTYPNGIQHVSVSETSHGTPVGSINSVNSLPSDNWLAGVTDASSACGIFNDKYNSTSCFYEPELLRRLSYQAVFDAFTNVLLGNIVHNEISTTQVTNTSIFDTILSDAKELSFLASDYSGTQTSNQVTSLQDLMLAQQFWVSDMLGLVNAYDATLTIPLQEAMEQMFQNITVSIMSSAALRPNATASTVPPNSTVTFQDFHNVYQYSWERLWLAYGLAILLAMLIVVVGLFAMASNEASFTNNFSTVLRTTRHAFLTADVSLSDASGEDPLPKHLSKAILTLERPAGLSQVSEDESSEGKRSLDRKPSMLATPEATSSLLASD